MNTPQPKDWIMGIAPYIPGRSTLDPGQKVVKLSSNENPLGTSPFAEASYASAEKTLSRYPDGNAALLRDAIATHHGLDPERVIYGTGSGEILHLATGAYAGLGDEVLFMHHSFALYEIAARRVGAIPVIVPDKDYATDVDAMLAAITPKTKVVFLTNPNNPTGTLTSRADIARLHAALPAHILLVLDQAYTEYLDISEADGGLELAKTASNILITRTFSKIYGLAAERIGWGYGSVEIIDALHRIRAPFNVTTGGQKAAIAALSDQDFVTQSRTHNRIWREWLSREISAFGNMGLRVVPSYANFILVLFNGKVSAEQAYNGLMSAGFITRWLPEQDLANGLRITIGTEAETRGVMTALRTLIEAAG